jgi:hypothetical protein
MESFSSLPAAWVLTRAKPDPASSLLAPLAARPAADRRHRSRRVYRPTAEFGLHSPERSRSRRPGLTARASWSRRGRFPIPRRPPPRFAGGEGDWTVEFAPGSRRPAYGLASWSRSRRTSSGPRPSPWTSTSSARRQAGLTGAARSTLPSRPRPRGRSASWSLSRRQPWSTPAAALRGRRGRLHRTTHSRLPAAALRAGQLVAVASSIVQAQAAAIGLDELGRATGWTDGSRSLHAPLAPPAWRPIGALVTVASNDQVRAAPRASHAGVALRHRTGRPYCSAAPAAPSRLSDGATEDRIAPKRPNRWVATRDQDGRPAYKGSAKRPRVLGPRACGLAKITQTLDQLLPA